MPSASRVVEGERTDVTPLGALELSLLVRLADLLARPLAYVETSRCGLASLPGAVVAQMGRSPAFTRPVNRALAESLGFKALALDAAFAARLRVDARLRLAIRIVTARFEILDTAALTCSAAALHRVFVRIVLKGEREALRAALGDDLMQMSLREAATFCPSLADAPLRPEDWTGLFAKPPAEQRALLRRFGLQWLCAVVEAVSPPLAAAFASRFDAEADVGGHRAAIASVRDIQLEQTTRLLRRRVQEWTDITS